MKKVIYVKPEMNVIVADAVQMFAGSMTIEGAGVANSSNKGNEDQGADVRGNRGSWGDLWN